MTTRDSARVLRVDLTDEVVTSEAVPPRWVDHFIGGKGLGARYLYDEVPTGADPLGPANRLCLFKGPFSGHLPGETRYVAITKSPLSGLFVDSYSGGDFADAIVGALGDHLGIVVEGQADEPMRLILDDDGAQLAPADDLWGLDTEALADAVDGPVAGIGPAGEAGVRFATIATDGGDHHAGRGGTGAVLGAKRLKAIVARGAPDPNPALEAAASGYEERFADSPTGRAQRASGTGETVDAADATGVLPTRGWRDGSFEDTESLGIEALRQAATARESADTAVPGDFEIEGTVARGGMGIALGANLGIGDIDAVVDLAATCDRLGIDLIETGNAVAWAMLASEAGHIDRSVPIGDADAARSLIEEIATRSTPLGDRLADGIDDAAGALGGDGLVPTVKSLSAASYDARPSPSMALAFATSDRGACHRRANPVFNEVTDPDGWGDTNRVEAVVEEQDRTAVLWSLIVDDVTAPAFADDLGAALFEAVGRQMSPAALETAGERIWTLTRLFNVREGVGSADDALPAAFQRPIVGGPADGAAIDLDHFEALRRRYYRRRRWDQDGRPTHELLEELHLLEAVDGDTPIGTRSAGR